jgi:hypothetical protein
MRLLVPLLFVMVAIYWVCELLWFVFVTNFENVVASLFICVVAFFFYWIINALQKHFRP